MSDQKIDQSVQGKKRQAPNDGLTWYNEAQSVEHTASTEKVTG